jgi:hypothetical protein
LAHRVSTASTSDIPDDSSVRSSSQNSTVSKPFARPRARPRPRPALTGAIDRTAAPSRSRKSLTAAWLSPSTVRSATAPLAASKVRIWNCMVNRS